MAVINQPGLLRRTAPLGIRSPLPAGQPFSWAIFAHSRFVNVGVFGGEPERIAGCIRARLIHLTAQMGTCSILPPGPLSKSSISALQCYVPQSLPKGIILPRRCRACPACEPTGSAISALWCSVIRRHDIVRRITHTIERDRCDCHQGMDIAHGIIRGQEGIAALLDHSISVREPPVQRRACGVVSYLFSFGP